MKVLRTVLCYPDMDRIIVDKEEQLARYDMTKVSAVNVTLTMTPEEFEKLRTSIVVSTGTPRA